MDTTDARRWLRNVHVSCLCISLNHFTFFLSLLLSFPREKEKKRKAVKESYHSHMRSREETKKIDESEINLPEGVCRVIALSFDETQ